MFDVFCCSCVCIWVTKYLHESRNMCMHVLFFICVHMRHQLSTWVTEYVYTSHELQATACCWKTTAYLACLVVDVRVWVTNYEKMLVAAHVAEERQHVLLLLCNVRASRTINMSHELCVRFTNYEQLLVAEEQQHVWRVLLLMWVCMSLELSTQVTDYVYTSHELRDAYHRRSWWLIH